MDKNNYIKT